MGFINLENLSKSYGRAPYITHALRDITLSFEKEQCYIISGPSGSGKTTLLNLIGGLDRPVSGNIEIGNIMLSDLSEKELTVFRRENIGYVFQDDALIPELTVYENIELPLILIGYDKKQRAVHTDRILKSLGIHLKKKNYPDDLSGGEKQRAAVARAVIHSPPIVLADEPTSNLDRESADRVINMLIKISEEFGTTVIISTHDRYIISEFKNRIILDYGKSV